MFGDEELVDDERDCPSGEGREEGRGKGRGVDILWRGKGSEDECSESPPDSIASDNALLISLSSLFSSGASRSASSSVIKLSRELLSAKLAALDQVGLFTEPSIGDSPTPSNTAPSPTRRVGDL